MPGDQANQDIISVTNYLVKEKKV